MQEERGSRGEIHGDDRERRKRRENRWRNRSKGIPFLEREDWCTTNIFKRR